MFEWLEKELAEVKTPRFHLVDGPVDTSMREVVQKSLLPVPESYKEFVLMFGNAKLYRNARNGYRIGIFAGPRAKKLDNGKTIYHLGYNESASVYVEPEATSPTMPIFEFEDGCETTRRVLIPG